MALLQIISKRILSESQTCCFHLGNEQFTSRAPEAVVAKEREKLASWREQAETLRRKRAQLGCAG